MYIENALEKAEKKRASTKIRNIYHFEIDVEVYQIRITLLLFCSLFSLDVWRAMPSICELDWINAMNRIEVATTKKNKESEHIVSYRATS